MRMFRRRRRLRLDFYHFLILVFTFSRLVVYYSRFLASILVFLDSRLSRFLFLANLHKVPLYKRKNTCIKR